MTQGSHISLFSGVGMTERAVEPYGFAAHTTVEVDSFCQSVLRARFPQAQHLDDVQFVNARNIGPFSRPLLLSGGFPCQDVGASGTGLGLNGSRSGLWTHFARLIDELRPDYVLIENSAMLRTRGLDVVINDLSRLGYDAEWDCIPASAVGAPHQRDRMFIVAWPNGMGDHHNLIHVPEARSGKLFTGCAWSHDHPRATLVASRAAHLASPAMGKATRRYPTPTRSDGAGGPGTTPKRTGGKNLRTVVAEIAGNGRLNPDWVEWMMGVPRNWTNPDATPAQWPTPWTPDPADWAVNCPRTVAHRTPNRSQRIRALGNGLVPQAANVMLDWLFQTHPYKP